MTHTSKGEPRADGRWTRGLAVCVVVLSLSMGAGLCPAGAKLIPVTQKVAPHVEPTPAFALQSGTSVGMVAPHFLLRGVNDDMLATTVARDAPSMWGPASWVGGAADPKRAMIIEFTATSSAISRRDLPQLVHLAEALRDEGLGVLLVATDASEEKRAEILDQAQESGVRFPVVHDRYRVVARRYGVTQLPCRFVLDADGVIRLVQTGDTNGMPKVEEQVRSLLRAKP